MMGVEARKSRCDAVNRIGWFMFTFRPTPDLYSVSREAGRPINAPGRRSGMRRDIHNPVLSQCRGKFVISRAFKSRGIGIRLINCCAGNAPPAPEPEPSSSFAERFSDV